MSRRPPFSYKKDALLFLGRASFDLISLFLEVLQGSFQSFFQGYFRSPVEVFYCFFVGEGGAVDVSFSHGAVGWSDLFACNFGENGDQVVQADFGLGAEVVAGVCVFGGKRQADAPGDVAGVDEVSGLFPVSENGNTFALGETFGEDADDAAFSPVALPFSVYVGKAEDHVVDAEGQMVEGQVFFHGHFGKAVEGKGNLGERLLDGQCFFIHVAVGGGGGGEDDPLYAVFPAAFQNVNGTGNVLVHIILRVRHGVADQGLCRQMDHRVEMFFAEEVFHSFIMGIHHFQPGVLGKVFPKACGEVVQGNDVIPCFHELAYQVGTNKAGAAGNENFHNFTFFYRKIYLRCFFIILTHFQKGSGKGMINSW